MDTTKLAIKLAAGDVQGHVKLVFNKPTTLTVRWNFSSPKSRSETVTELEGHVSGGWGDTFLLDKEGPYGYEVWSVTLASNPVVVSILRDEDC